MSGDELFHTTEIMCSFATRTLIDGFVTMSYGRRHFVSLQFGDATLLEEYDPIQDQWLVVQPIGGGKERMFVVGGILLNEPP